MNATKRYAIAGAVVAVALFLGAVAGRAEGRAALVGWGAFALLLLLALVLYLTRSREHREIPQAERDTSVTIASVERSIVQSGDSSIAQHGERNVVVAPGGTYNESAQTHKEPSGRVFVNLSPRELAAYYKGRLTIEADAIVKRYLNKWMRVAVELSDLQEFMGKLTFMAWDQERAIVSGTVADGERDAFLVLQPGAAIQIVGRLTRVADTGIDLTDVEIDA